MLICSQHTHTHRAKQKNTHQIRHSLVVKHFTWRNARCKRKLHTLSNTSDSCQIRCGAPDFFEIPRIQCKPIIIASTRILHTKYSILNGFLCAHFFASLFSMVSNGIFSFFFVFFIFFFFWYRCGSSQRHK